MVASHTTPLRVYKNESVSVLLPLPLAGPYDYFVPPNLAVSAGDFVSIPLGRREIKGVVWGNSKGELERKKLRNINGLLDIPRMSNDLRLLIEWTASYTLSPLGAVLRMSMSVPSALEPPRRRTGFLPAANLNSGQTDSRNRLTNARSRVLSVLKDGCPRIAADLGREAGVNSSVIRKMSDIGLLRKIAIEDELNMDPIDESLKGPVLSDLQTNAASILVKRVQRSNENNNKKGFSVTLLDGVTGSGKTEVYFESIAATLAAGFQVLVLVPEIALTVQWLQRFQERFGTRPLEWHSDLTGLERRLTWRAIISDKARVLVGARSALFLPFRSLGLIVIDEEHDGSFKQEEGVSYNARDMAVVRARFGDFPIVLSSATPSLETFTNVKMGRYKRIALPKRFGGAILPEIQTIDMRLEKMSGGTWLSPCLKRAMKEALKDGEQVMLFLNRRGYAPLTLCRQCGHRFKCPNCTSWLVEHKLQHTLCCHHCGYSMIVPEICSECGAPSDSLVSCGPGVERVAEEVAEYFSEAQYEIMASDTMQSLKASKKLVRRVQACEVDILIGTQVMAKGHHFPNLTLVGVVDADLGLSGGDLRAAERTFQLLYQLSGRAGRAQRSGKALLQTFQPEDPVIQALISGERDKFLALEASARKRHGMPPFSRLVAIIVSGKDFKRVENVARSLGRASPSGTGLIVHGPAAAPLAVLRGRHRFRLLLRADRKINVQQKVRFWLSRVQIPSGVRVNVDVDPYRFL